MHRKLKIKKGGLLLCLFLLCFASCLTAGNAEYRFRLYLKDKAHSPYKISRPAEYLSAKALERRKKWKIKTDWYDLPVSPTYVERLHSLGLRVLCLSKWNNTVLVAASDSAATQLRLSALPFVRETKPLGRFVEHEFPANTDSLRHALLRPDTIPLSDDEYGMGGDPIRQVNGVPLHEAGFCGKGMTIAVLDGGFYNADIVAPLQGVRILGTHNFQRPSHSVYAEHSHGMNVLSCIATFRPRYFVGTAPEAAFWLLVTEDTYTETSAEEDMWTAGVEFADSVGADIVSSSLGYTRFDRKDQNYGYWQQDGRTALISRTASMAACRGLMVVNSAGNEGDDSWKRIGFPADAPDILTVGAVRRDGVNTDFSSIGNTSDGRIKPDVMALGYKAYVVNTDGTLRTANGTSFSCPITAGMVACLMQACPRLTPRQIINVIRQSGNNAAHPDNVFGYGIPDYWKAYRSTLK